MNTVGDELASPYKLERCVAQRLLNVFVPAMTSYEPDEDERSLVLERYSLAGDLLCGVAYGIQLVLYLACATCLWHHREKSHARHLLVYITFLFVVQSVFVGVQSRTVQLMFVENRNYPEGVWAYFLATQALAVNVTFDATLFILTLLCDCLVFWRCWIIWAASGFSQAALATLFPAVMILGSFVTGVFWTLQSSQPGLSFYSKLPLAFGTAYFTLSLGVNILLTALIVLRLYQYRRRITSALGAAYAKQYVSLATIIVESAAAYSVFALLFLVTYAAGNVTSQLWLGVSSSAQQISTYMIIYRLALGRGWSPDTLSSTVTFTTNPIPLSTVTMDKAAPTVDIEQIPVDRQSPALPFGGPSH